MPPIFNHITNQPRIATSDAHRSVLGLKLGSNAAKHSPDGYFGHEEALRSWRFSAPDTMNIRRRSKGYIGNDVDCVPLTDVQEEEDTSNAHVWRKPSRYDSRSPCPALNVLANHGYLPRDGRQIGVWEFVQALREGYGASWVLAIGLTVVSFIILRLGGVGKGWLHPTVDLEELAAHGVLEHHGSLTHADMGEDVSDSPSHPRSRSTSSSSSTAISMAPTPTGPPYSGFLTYLPYFSFLAQLPFFPLLARILTRFLPSFLLTYNSTHVYAPSRPSRTLIRALFADSASGTHLTLSDVARARVRREMTCRPTTSRIISQFADGEFAMTLGFLNSGPDPNEPKVQLSVLKDWLEEERLPQGWKPTHVHGLWQTHMNTERVRALMAGMRKYMARGRTVKSVVYE